MLSNKSKKKKTIYVHIYINIYMYVYMHDTVINCFFSINCHYAYNKAFLFLCLYFRLGWKKKTKKKESALCLT